MIDRNEFAKKFPNIQFENTDRSGYGKFTCNTCGNVWTAAWSDITKSKYGCRECYKLQKRTLGSEILEKLSSYHPTLTFDIDINKRYHNSEEITYVCSKHGEFKKPIKALLFKYDAVKHGCPECGKESANEKQTETKSSNSRIKFLPKLKEKLAENNIELAIPDEEFRGRSFKVKVKCKICGCEWEAAGNDLYAGHGCPICTSKITSSRVSYDGTTFDSKDEVYYYSYLKDNNIPFEYQIPFQYEYKGSRVYTCDFKRLDTNQLIEIKGSHFFAEDGGFRNVFNSENLYDEILNKRLELMKKLNIILITDKKTIPQKWESLNPDIRVGEIKFYKRWFLEHHSKEDIKKIK